MEPVRSAVAIEMAIQQLLEMLCKRLEQEGKGIRHAVLKCYRIDGEVVQTAIATSRASRNIKHLYHLFTLKTDSIEPALGIELFVMEASRVEDIQATQEALWSGDSSTLADAGLSELLDRITGKFGNAVISRYLPVEHYWPERSYKAADLTDTKETEWRTDLPRPVYLLPSPEPIEVTVPIPDYPPMQFIYRKKLHQVRKADGPERIEREWWLETGELRDYYQVEDQDGRRYWLFRSGIYAAHRNDQWFIHGFFA